MSAPVLERPVRLIIGSAPSRSLTRKEVLAEVTRFRRTAGAAVIEDFSFKPGFVYNTVRAISARVNQNYDAWPSEELKVAYKTFLGKPCFVNHHNEDPELARGVVIAARYVEKGADKYVETIMETDGQRFPLLGHELRTGGLDSVSMGVEAGFTICSICENRASDIFDMCNHVKFHKGEYLRHPKTGKKTLVYENCHKLGFFELSYVFDPADETAVISRVIAASRHHPEIPFFEQHWLRQAFGETRAPKEVDTLRTEGEDEGGDWTRDPHKEWIEQTARRRHADDSDIPWQSDIESPPELQAPDLDDTKRLDRDQESAGLDGDRHAEDAEEFGVPSPNGELDPDYDDPEPPESENEPAVPINSPGSKKGRRTSYRGAPMSRSRYAADEDEATQDQGQQEDPDALVSEAEDDLDAYDQQNGSGDYGDDGGDDYADEDSGDDGGDSDAPPWADDGGDDGGDSGDDGGYDDSPDAAYDDGGDPDGGGGDDAPPWIHENREGRRRAARPVKKRSGQGNRRAAAQGGEMSRQSLGTRQRTAQQYGNQPRRHFAGDDGHMDGGPYGVDDSQGAQEDIFISQVPGAEAVDLGDDEGGIPNSPNNLVANRGRFDPDHYQRLAEVIAAMPPEQRHAVAYKMALACKQDNPRFNWRTLYTAAKVPVPSRRTAEELTSPDKVDPPLPDTGASDIKGSEFESLALDNVETQPKDASVHAFRQFDSWLQQATGRTARQHGNANYIRRAAVSYSKATRNPQAALQSLFPTLDYVLHYARNSEQTKEANMRRHAEDESLDVAAPGGRIDVEAPVKNVTDADAQSSQFDLGDFAGNASDGLADPVLDAVDGNAGTWAPDKEARVRLATATEALRCAEAHIAAMPDKYTQDDRWQLVARFETLRGPVVRDRTRLLEDVLKNSRSARKVTAGRSRGTNGIPPGLGSGRRTSSRREGSVNDPRNPATDGAFYF